VILEQELQIHVAIEAHRIHLHEDVDVAVRAGVPAQEGAEQPDAQDSEPRGQHLAVAPQELQDRFARQHGAPSRNRIFFDSGIKCWSDYADSSSK
jgi:hypothetical protein